ncbi:transport protein Avl9-domain-containing protein [Panaeolus papilionaceus]|nr:transport protein Avl9-domain-containing protein [Panaeolus papilionaceus]
MSALLPPSPTIPSHTLPRAAADDSDDDTASQRSISLSSPPLSRRDSFASGDPRDLFSSDPKRDSFATSSDSHRDSLFTGSDARHSFATQSSQTSVSQESSGFDEYEKQDVAMNLSSTKGFVESADVPAAMATAVSTGSMGSAVTSSTVNEQMDERDKGTKPVTYPPTPPNRDDTMSISSFASTSSRKARPESLLITPTSDPIVLGVALVDFNHLVGPRIEYSKGDIFEDEEVAKILPFLALPDGAHLSKEDYSYFHLVKPGPSPTTIFGISCNQQIASSHLLVKGPDVTRSTVQKAVVVLAAKPVFGPIREKLRVVTTALFLQRDFSDYSILDDFGASLEPSLRGQLTESGLYMGTSIREFVHTFRQKTLILVKALMLQKKIMFYGYPVEKLCTYQYSLVSLLPGNYTRFHLPLPSLSNHTPSGLLQTLDDCGSPPLAARAPTLSKPTSLRTSDHKSMMAFLGLPLDLFGKDALFQPYLPLQQLDMLKATPSWLCGCTNSIIAQQGEIEVLVNVETGAVEIREGAGAGGAGGGLGGGGLERVCGLTAADRKWMDDVVRDVNETWEREDEGVGGMHTFKGSDDYLRSKFEEYISAALSTVKYQDFMSKGEQSGVIITGGSGGSATAIEDFNPVWIAEFKKTNAYEVWERITDPLLFDIVEPRHPCTDRPSVVADIGLRLQEGIQELKLEQQLAPAREAVARTVKVGSAGFFRAVENVRGRWGMRSASSTGATESASGGAATGNEQGRSPAPSVRSINDAGSSRASTPPVEVSKADLYDADADSTWDNGLKTAVPAGYGHNNIGSGNGTTMTATSYTPYIPKPRLRPFSLTSNNSLPPDSPLNSPDGGEGDSLAGSGYHNSTSTSNPNTRTQEEEPQTARPSFSAWSAGLGSFLSAKTGRFSMARTPTTPTPGPNHTPSSASVTSITSSTSNTSTRDTSTATTTGMTKTPGYAKPPPTAPVLGRFSTSSTSSGRSVRSRLGSDLKEGRGSRGIVYPDSPDAMAHEKDLERERRRDVYTKLDQTSPTSADGDGDEEGEGRYAYSPTVGEAVGSPLFNGVTPGTSPTAEVGPGYAGMGSIAGVMMAGEKKEEVKKGERQVKKEVQKEVKEVKKDEGKDGKEEVKNGLTTTAAAIKPSANDDDDYQDEDLSESEMAQQAYAI